MLACIAFMVTAAFVVATLFGYYYRKDNILPPDGPIIRMLPSFLAKINRFHDYTMEVLESCGGTFAFQPLNWFTDVVWLTSDPANVHHIMSANFSNYPKGLEWRKRFDLFSDSIFNTDFKEWKYQRRLARGFFNHQRFHQLMQTTFEDCTAKKLLPDLEYLSMQQDVPVALQHLLDKHMLYIACRMLYGCDLDSALINSHESVYSKAIGDACEAIFFRHILPESIWKVQKWLGIGTEKRLSEAGMALDHLLSKYVTRNQEMVSSRSEDQAEEADICALEHMILPYSASDKAVRDNALAFIFAVHDTTCTALNWFFWILSKHPVVKMRIREEIQTFLPKSRETRWYDAPELNKMVYLHAALCETLRLYPPVPFQARTPVQKDTLPSGHKVDPTTVVLICIYAMGRMSSIWGDDCREFKPERWITDHGGIKHEPAHKFFSFLAGPRICLGKDIAFSIMKATVATVLNNYDIEVVENQQITPRLSIVLHMNHDLMVTVKKRSMA